jgi:predicted nucleotidyltransferase component of viral defense system
MEKLTLLQQVEVVHLTFLRLLEHAVPKNCYALKGGCNLRFFFKSIRYSEDMDLDVWTLRSDQLQEKVSKTLASPQLLVELSNLGLEPENLRASKQTETTQRWKMTVREKDAALSLPTKIEFSRRAPINKENVLFESVDSGLISNYRLLPVMALHYGVDAALNQKVSALLNRAQTQARDIFDISLLVEKGAKFASLSAPAPGKNCKEFEQRILSIDYHTFHSQVVSYLDPRFQDYYDKDRWETLQLRLIEQAGGV